MNSTEQSVVRPPDASTGPGILEKTTYADRGIVEVPLLTPHLDYRRVEGDKVLLVSETFNTLLDGRCSLDLLPLLDGSRSRHDLIAALAGRHSAVDVQTALVFLASRGYVVSADFTMGREHAAFWSAMGVSPRRAEERLQAARVAIAGDDGHMARQLACMGVSVGAVEPTVRIVVCDDYLDKAHAETNQRQLVSAAPWTLVKPTGVKPLFGPIFRSSGSAPCWECFADRLRHNQEVDQFIRRTSGAEAAIAPGPTPTPFIEQASSIAAVEIAKWLVLGEEAALHDQAISIDNLNLEMTRHRVMRRPQCRSCGDEKLFRPERPACPVTLQSSPKPVWNSGGVRAVPPEQTLRKYRHLISPVSGVVAQLERQTDEADPWWHVCWAGSNHLNMGVTNLDWLQHSLRNKSSGKGSTPRQSEASAFCEAIERYSGGYAGDEIRCRRRFADYAEAPVTDAIRPNDVMLFSERQYDDADDLNVSHRFDFIPSRFDPDVEIDWSPVWSLTHDRRRYLPTALLYYGVPAGSGTVFCRADSNGCAAGNSLEEAILQGFFELAERDAFATWWYNRLSRPLVDLESFGDDYLAGAYDYYRNYHRDMWVLDITNDFGIPVFVAVSLRTDMDPEYIIYGAGAHFDPHIALLRAVCEMNQCLYGIRDVKVDGTGNMLSGNPAYHRWLTTAELANHRYLAPDRAATPSRKANYAAPDTEDVKEDVERCIALVADKGMEFLVLDQTRPDVGMPVAKVIVPGMRHFWQRLAPGRLYDVPVKMGWLDAPNAEADLNPSAVVL